MEQLNYNLLFRLFVSLSMDDATWDRTVFPKNQERWLRGDIARAFFERMVTQAQVRHLLSAEHFTADGTLIEALAGVKSTPPDDPGNPTVDFPRRAPLERHPCLDHVSREARLARKSRGHKAQLAPISAMS